MLNFISPLLSSSLATTNKSMGEQEPPQPPPQLLTPPLPEHRFKTFEITASSISYTKTSSATNSNFFSNILIFNSCTSTPPKYILKDISLTAYPSEIFAIVGPSGAGKSTLLDILAARRVPSNGSLLLNSTPVNPTSFRKLCSYVPQHDANLPMLTVRETFIFTATLLYPKNSDLSTIVDSLLNELGLTHVAHSRLGQALSGGEKRRVSIGLSLLHDPGVLILDEPTSGLDSTSAFNVIETLKSIATSRQRTVVLSIHQPSYKILATFDKILLLSKGSVVHHGTLSSLDAFLVANSFTVPPQLNALEFAMEVVNQLHDKTNNSSKVNHVLLPPHHSYSKPSHSEYKKDANFVRYKSSRFHEILTLYNRFWKIIYRTKQLLLTNTLEALFVGLVLGTIYLNIGYDKESIEKRSGLFAFTLTFLLSSTAETTLPIFVNERPILLREASSGVYRLSSYLIANTLVFVPYLLIIALIYSVSVYFLVGLCSSSYQAFAFFVLVIWFVVLMANSFALFVSSIAPDYIAGTTLVTILLGGFFLFSGYFISKGCMPKYWLFAHFLSMYKYALDAFLINEYSCLVSRCMIWFEEGDTTSCMVTGKDVLEKRGLHESHRWMNVYMLFGFFVFYRVLCFLVLIRRVSKSNK